MRPIPLLIINIGMWQLVLVAASFHNPLLLLVAMGISFYINVVLPQRRYNKSVKPPEDGE